MDKPDSDDTPAGFVQIEDGLYEPTTQKKQSNQKEDYKDMMIELHGGKHKPKYKWVWGKIK